MSKIKTPVFFVLALCFFSVLNLCAAEDIHQNLNIRFERQESVKPNPYYPNALTTDYAIYMYWSAPSGNLCHYQIYKDGVRVGVVYKNTTFYRIVAFGGGFSGADLNEAYSKYTDFRDYLLGESYYNHRYKVVADQGCYGLPSIFDEVLVTEPNPAVIDRTKELSQSKITTVAEPINVANGNMFTTQIDISIPAAEIPLELSRTYNSQDDFKGSFGFGWRSNFDINLTEQPDNSVVEIDETGVYTVYTKNSDSTYTASVGKYSVLTKNSDGSYTVLRKYGKKLYFDNNGRLIKIEGRNGNTITVTRAPEGIILEVSDSSGRKLLFIHDSAGYITQVTDPAARVFKYEYDAVGNLIKAIDPLNNVTVYQYDANHNLIQQTDANNHSLYFEYDSFDRAYHSWQDDKNNEVILSFDPANKSTITADSLGNITRYKYNDYGLVTEIIDSMDKTRIFTWDSDLNKTSATDQNGNTTGFTYDSRSNLLTVKDPFGNTTSFTYELNFDFISSAADALGNLTQYTYDIKGNLLEIKDSLDNSVKYTYDSIGRLIQICDANNNITSFEYDTSGNLINRTDALNNRTNFSYDAIGNLIQTTNVKGYSTQFSYDALNRITQINYPDNSKTAYNYDAAGNLISFSDSNNNSTSYVYDTADRLIKITDCLGNNTQYQYDTEGNRIAVIDAKQNKT